MKILQKKTFFILMLIMVVNAFSIGMIIPLLYPYAQKFGLSSFDLSLLFISYSVFQFIATPFIGRLSDKYGRKPLLLICLFGTGVSFFMMAGATSALMLFLARFLDGITGGDFSTVKACISDTVEAGNKRTKAYGLIGAAFGVGFLIGPALGGYLSKYGLSVPFWFAGIFALIGTILGFFFLEETNTKKIQHIRFSVEKLFHVKSLFSYMNFSILGIVMIVGLIMTTAAHAYYLGFQTFTVDVLKLTPLQIGYIFTLLGIIPILSQVFIIQAFLKWFKKKRFILFFSLLISSLAFVGIMFTRDVISFVVILLVLSFFSAFAEPIISSIISNRSSQEKQGEVMGIYQSYCSLGQIIGPLIAGIVSIISIPLVFGMSGFLLFGASFLVLKIMKKT